MGERYILQGGLQIVEPATSQRRERNASARSSHRRDKSGQRGDQLEGRAQAIRERVVDLAVQSGQVGAIAATLGLMIVETSCAFLESCVSGVRSKNLATTYIDNASDGASEIAVTAAASNTANFVLAIVDDGSDLEDKLLGAIIVPAVTDLGNDSVALVAEGGEGVLDVGVGLIVGWGCGLIGGRGGGLIGSWGVGLIVSWDGSGEGHSTGSDNSEDGREAHCKRRWRRLLRLRTKVGCVVGGVLEQHSAQVL